MPTYAVESTRQPMIATGIVSPVMVWEEKDGRRRPSETEQERDAGKDAGGTGLPLWQVEVMYTQESFGQKKTVTANVTVPSEVKPNVQELTAVQFGDLSVFTRVTKAGQLIESWRAGGMATATPAEPAPTPKPSGDAKPEAGKSAGESKAA